ncbi:MAG: histidine kinase dimerization/phospho-acceptor domain-containing protein [Deltaproteobacteria bacterium]|nr:histidine kinase dimerization/phospho-acceptor domain-containing protein [Deltaproteobacteria bacterium]
MKSSLQSKIAVAMWVITAISTLIASLFTVALLVQSHRDSVRNQLQASAASLISLGISSFSELNDFEQLNLFIEDALEMEKINKVVRIYDPSGKLVFTTAGRDYDSLPDHLELLGKKPTFLTVTGKQRRYETLVVPYLGEGKKSPYYLQVAIPLPRYSQIFEHLWWQYLLLLTFLIGVSLFLSRRLAERLLQPVVTVANHLQRMDPQKMEQWVPLKLEDREAYLEEIVQGINLLTQRTRAAVSQIRKMSRYVAHELRTPLTILRGEAETALLRKEATTKDYREVLKSSLEEVERMAETINTVLQVSDSERKLLLVRPVFLELIPWIQEHRSRWEKTLGNPIQLDATGIDRPAKVRVDPKLFYYLIDNVVRNIRDHTPPGTSCSLFVGRSNGKVMIRLSDNGPGFSEKLLSALNQQGDLASASEIGIGLSLCLQIAEIGGLEPHFFNQPKGGAVVEIQFS